MDQPRVLRTLLIAAAFAALALGLAACGGEETGGTTTGTSTGATTPQPAFTDDRDGLVEPEPVEDRANRNPRGASVNYNDPPPPIAADVEAAARAAGCTTKGHQSEVDPQNHIEGESATVISIPPLSGAHSEYWARWGVYNKPVPYKYQLHNLEHGGVIVHYGTEVPVAGVNAVRELWARKPAFVMVVPDSTPTFPKDAVVAGSQQRWLVCKPFTPAQIPAVEAFIDAYRGRGPEPASAANIQGVDRPDDLPAPKIEDKAAG